MDTAKDYTKYTSHDKTGDHRVAAYLRALCPDWDFEMCGEYTISYKPAKAKADYEALAVISFNNRTMAKTVYVPNKYVDKFEQIMEVK
jgi:hypothetical protein